MTIRVLLADDQKMVRRGLRLILEREQDLSVVAEAGDGAEAIALARRHRPDVCLVDVQMPKLNGVEVTRALAGPGIADPMRVVIVTTFDHDEYVTGAIRAGAVGFVLKDASHGVLVEAVRAAHAGEALISPSLTLALVRKAVAAEPRARTDQLDRLTPRELDTVRLLAVGRTNQQIADELTVSLSTVKSNVASVQGKLGMRNRVEITAWAWGNGLVEPG